MKKVIVSAVLGFSSLFTLAHAAGTDSTQFEVKLTVNESCKFIGLTHYHL